MPAFLYKAVDKSGRPARGSLIAVNEIDLELRLRRMGLDLITLRALRPGSASLARGKITRRDLITFCFDVEQIVRAGIPLLEGMRDLRDSMDNPRFREIIASLIEDMEGGKTLSQALATHPVVFNHVFVGLVKAGETAGRLPEIFENLGTTLKWQDEIILQTRRLMLYPMLVLALVIVVVVVLLVVLVPQVVSLLKTMNIALPIQTRVLIALSNAIIAWWPLFLGLPIIAATFITIAIRRSQRARYLWDYIQLQVPVTGEILKKIILARFANFFALMYQSGITVLEAIKTSEEIVVNRVIADGLARAGQQIAGGESLTESFRNIGVFPPLVLRMLRVGETTGALDSALLNISYFYNRDVKEAVDRAMKLLGPVMTIVLASILLFIMMATLMPVYDIIGQLKL
ncbi:MAG: type II secretion system F family protein [Pseudomonadota bacterium]|nr:type II secretion system F family protein [Burkholderiales bacterium]MDQ3196736.1 type II secretion system F family protein [Pseudomonadota bacterium]